jgi:hypothetical protein
MPSDRSANCPAISVVSGMPNQRRRPDNTGKTCPRIGRPFDTLHSTIAQMCPDSVRINAHFPQYCRAFRLLAAAFGAEHNPMTKQSGRVRVA